MFNFLHTHIPNPILFELGPITVHWYGFVMTLALVVGVFVTSRLAQRRGIEPKLIYDLSFYVIIFGLIGARLYHVLNELPYYAAHPDQIVAFWNGGLALHGGLMAAVLTIWFYMRRHPRAVSAGRREGGDLRGSVLNVTDAAAPALALGHALGRWGNYFNQELYGLPTDAPWGIYIAIANRVEGFEAFSHFHPTFLYESILNLIIFGILIFLIRNHHSRVQNTSSSSGLVRGSQCQPGVITATYLILYSLTRISMELFRIDSTPLIFGVRLPILVSVLFIVLALAYLWYNQKQLDRH